MVSYRKAATAIAVALGLAAGSPLLGPTQVMAQDMSQDVGEEEEPLLPSQEAEDDDADDQGQHVQQPLAGAPQTAFAPGTVMTPEVADGCPVVSSRGPEPSIDGRIVIWDQNGDGRISIGEQLTCLEQVAQAPATLPAMPGG